MYKKISIPAHLGSITIISAVSFLNIASRVAAEETSISISPTHIEIAALEVNHIERELTIENHSDHEIMLSPQLLPFRSDQRTNSIHFVTDPQTSLAYAPLFNGISFYTDGERVSTLIVPAQTQKRIRMLMDIPKDLTRSDYYFSAVFTTKEPSLLSHSVNTIQAQNSIRVGVASNILVTTEKNSQNPLQIEMKGDTLSFHTPTVLILTVSNPQAPFKPIKIQYTVSNIFNQRVTSGDIANTTILAATKKEYHIPLKSGVMLPGIYRTEVTVISKQNTVVQKAQFRFFYVPFISILMIMGLLITVMVIKRRLKRYAY